MNSRIGQDTYSGLMFVVIGLGALWIGADYPMGTPQRPGTGVLPYFLSCGLVGIGAALAIKARFAGDAAMPGWSWRPLIMVTLATLAFGFLIDTWGLVASMLVSLTLCAAGTPETRWREYMMFLAIMIAIGFGTFIWLLGMPIPTWPNGIAKLLSGAGR